MRRILSAAVLWLASGMASGATTYLVRPDGGGDYPTIDAAIQLVPEGSVIELADGTFVGDGNRDLYFRGKAIIVRSQSGDPSRCILDLADSLPHSGFIFQNGEDTLSVLEGVTVRRGRNILGAGVTCWNGGSPRIVGCVFSDNVATDENYGGGAIYCTSAPVIEGCRFLRNASARGGALMVRPGGAPVLRGVTFAENHASVAGGALYLYQCDVRAVDCLFLDNAATDAGGAVLAGHTGDYDFTRCTFSGSTAGDGAATYCNADGRYAFTQCTFVRNAATARGGAVACRRPEACAFVNCTFSANSAAQGAVLWDHPDTYVRFEQCILAFATSGAAVFCDGVTILPRFTCCDIFGNAGGDWVDCLAGQSDLRGNISLDPLFCGPPAEDLHLMEDSPCAPYAPPHPECPLVGACPVGCGLPAAADGAVAGAPFAGLWIASGGPTPSTGSVAIRFRVPATSAGVPVELTVHDASGRLVRALAGGTRSPGTHRVLWDGSDLRGRPVAAGVYVCRLVAGRERAQVRLVWVR